MTPAQAIAYANPCYFAAETQDRKFQCVWPRGKKQFGVVLTANVGEE